MCDLLISAMQFERVQVLKSGRDNLVQKKKTHIKAGPQSSFFFFLLHGHCAQRTDPLNTYALKSFFF